MSWTWTLLDGAGNPIAPPTAHAEESVFNSQSDAETWIGEVWRELADAGVAAVTLHQDNMLVYGPMSLRPVGE